MQLQHTQIYKTLLLLLALAGSLVCSAQYTDTVCTGYTGRVYGADSIAGQTYTWVVKGGAITSGQGGPTITVDWGNIAGDGVIMAVPKIVGGCDGDTLKGLVLIENKFQVNISGPDVVCIGETVKLQGSGAPDYRWSTGETSAATQLKIVADTNVWLIGRSGACNSDTAFAFVGSIVTPQALIISNVQQDAYEGDTVSFVFGGSDAEKVVWLIDGERQVLSPGQTYDPLLIEPGDYKVMQVATNKGKCFDTAYYSFTMGVLGEAFIPNAFTPNGDGHNNIFEIDGNGYTHLELSIYDRWGALLYESKGIDRLAWNGYYKGEPVPDGVYAYHLTAWRGANTIKHYNGSITVIK